MNERIHRRVASAKGLEWHVEEVFAARGRSVPG
jgi:hypothetical protein